MLAPSAAFATLLRSVGLRFGTAKEINQHRPTSSRGRLWRLVWLLLLLLRCRRRRDDINRLCCVCGCVVLLLVAMLRAWDTVAQETCSDFVGAARALLLFGLRGVEGLRWGVAFCDRAIEVDALALPAVALKEAPHAQFALAHYEGHHKFNSGRGFLERAARNPERWSRAVEACLVSLARSRA